MTMRNELLRTIAKERDHLRGAELRVAEVVLRIPEAVMAMTMAQLAEAAQTSDPTVVRFIRKFDLVNYQDFKVRLAQGLLPQAPFYYEPVASSDSVETLVEKTIHNSLNAIQRFASDVKPAAIEKAVSKILQAQSIFLFGLGISETTAFDAEHKFFRLGLHTRAVLDSQRQLLLAQTLRPEELVVFFSHSGATKSLVTAASTARVAGAATVAITVPDSRLAQACDLCIGVPGYQHTELYTPLTARMNHLLVINMIVTAIGIKQGRKSPDNLEALDPWFTDKFVD